MASLSLEIRAEGLDVRLECARRQTTCRDTCRDSVAMLGPAQPPVTSQFSTESAVLERGEERVEFGERGAVGGFQFVDGGDAIGELGLQPERWKCNRSPANIGNTDRVETRGCLSCTQQMPSTARRVEVFADVEGNDLPGPESSADDVILVDATCDRPVPQSAAANFGRIAVTFHHEKIVLFESRSRDFCIRRPNRLYFT
jgi:hypothetical protein